jgi:hypothetical protein
MTIEKMIEDILKINGVSTANYFLRDSNTAQAITGKMLKVFTYQLLTKQKLQETRKKVHDIIRANCGSLTLQKEMKVITGPYHPTYVLSEKGFFKETNFSVEIIYRVSTDGDIAMPIIGSLCGCTPYKVTEKRTITHSFVWKDIEPIEREETSWVCNGNKLLTS